MTVTLTCYRRNVIIILDILCFWNTVHEFLEININKLSSAICVSVFMLFLLRNDAYFDEFS